MKKLMSVLTALTMICGMSVSVSAQKLASTTFNRPLDTERSIAFALREKESLSDTVYVNTEELKNGDYIFKTAILLETEDSVSDMMHLNVTWDAVTENLTETPYILTNNCYSYSVKWNDERTNKILKEIELSDDNLERTFIRFYEDYYYSAGPGMIYIVNMGTGEKEFFKLDVDEETGTASVTFSPSCSSGYYTKTFHHYNPNTPYGEVLQRTDVNIYQIHAMSGFGGAWTTEKRDSYYEMGGFEVKVNQNTPEGTYYIMLRDGCSTGTSNVMCSMEATLAPTNLYSETGENDPAYWLKIVVGSGNEEAEGQAYDVNGDGKIDVSDATEELRLYAEAAVNADAQIYKSADGRTPSIANATAMLRHYAESAAGLR